MAIQRLMTLVQIHPPLTHLLQKVNQSHSHVSSVRGPFRALDALVSDRRFLGVAVPQTIENNTYVIRTRCPPGCGAQGMSGGTAHQKIHSPEAGIKIGPLLTHLLYCLLRITHTSENVLTPSLSRDYQISCLVPRFYPTHSRQKRSSRDNSISVPRSPSKGLVKSINCRSSRCLLKLSHILGHSKHFTDS